MTAPYLHTGAYATLLDVIDFYDQGGGDSQFAGVKDPLLVALNLSMAEKSNLVEFLLTLTGEPVRAALTEDIR
jgi:cytochrome c peroxidase